MEQPGELSGAPSIRTSLYHEVVRAAIWLRWLVIFAGALWLYLAQGEAANTVWLLGGVATYNAVLTALQRLGRHPPLVLVSVLDLVALAAFLVLRSPTGDNAVILFGFFVLMLTAAYGWAGVAFSLGGYVIGEGAALLMQPAVPRDLESLLLGGGFLTVLAVLLGVLIDRYEGLGERLARVSIHDRVTGLYNRQYFAEALDQLHKLAIRGQSPYSVLVIEVAALETVKREEGWPAGDRLLRTVGAEARAAIRSTDLVGRVGEDKFAIALPNTGLPAAEQVARKLQDRLRPVGGKFGLAIGLADIRPTWDNSFEDGLRAAFRAVERAKTGGEDRVATVPAPDQETEDDQ